MSAALEGMALWPADTSEPVCDLTAGDLLREAARETPNTIAIREIAPPGAPSLTGAEDTDRTWTYAQLLADAQVCAQWLLTRFTPGERIVVWAPNVPEWIVLQYGIALAGLVLVTANPALRSSELRYVLDQSRAAGIFFTSDFRGTDMAAVTAEAATGLAGLREQVNFTTWPALMAEARDLDADLPLVRPDEPAQIQYTSAPQVSPRERYSRTAAWSPTPATSGSAASSNPQAPMSAPCRCFTRPAARWACSAPPTCALPSSCSSCSTRH